MFTSEQLEEFRAVVRDYLPPDTTFTMRVNGEADLIGVIPTPELSQSVRRRLHLALRETSERIHPAAQFYIA